MLIIICLVCLAVALVATIAGIVYLALAARRLKSERAKAIQQHADLAQLHAAAGQEITALKERLGGITDIEAEKARIQADVARIRLGTQAAVQRFQEQRQKALNDFQEQQRKMAQELQAQRGVTEAEINSLKVKVNLLRAELEVLNEQQDLQSFGFYQPRYDFQSTTRYQVELDVIRARQKQMIQQKTAAVSSIPWTVNGSATEGRKQINQTLKLLLRAFNGESDAAIAKVKFSNMVVMQARINKAHQAINALAQVQQCFIAPAYRDLKLDELSLVYEYQEKLQQEKDEQRLIREQMREEELAQKELERERQRAEQEEQRYADALARARTEVEQAVGARQQKLLREIEELQRRLTEAQANKERAIAQAQLTRLGHVYVISNIGSFGENVYKIGMTRRLEPTDRVRELGGASVPFSFDIHAMIRSNDAPALETALHRAFRHRRVNQISDRREFFRVTLDEIAVFVKAQNADITFTHEPEAKEYRQTLAVLAAGQNGQPRQ